MNRQQKHPKGRSFGMAQVARRGTLGLLDMRERVIALDADATGELA